MEATHYLKQAGIQLEDTHGRPGRHRRNTDRSAPASHADHPGGIEIGRLQRLVRRLTLGRDAPA